MKEITFENLPQAVTQLFSKLESIEQLLLAYWGTGKQETEDLLTIQQAAEFLICRSRPCTCMFLNPQFLSANAPAQKGYGFQSRNLPNGLKQAANKPLPKSKLR